MGKIYYNIETTPYSFRYGSYEFFFTSEIRLQKFKENYENICIKIKADLCWRFRNDIDIQKEYLMLIYYSMIEDRGFKVLNNDKLITNDFRFKVECIYGN